MIHMRGVRREELTKQLVRKMAPPLVTLLSSPPEVQWVALRNINLLLQKRSDILSNEMRVFFCKYNDPLYVKVEKLDIMVRLANDHNVDALLSELKEYVVPPPPRPRGRPALLTRRRQVCVRSRCRLRAAEHQGHRPSRHQNRRGCRAVRQRPPGPHRHTGELRRAGSRGGHEGLPGPGSPLPLSHSALSARISSGDTHPRTRASSPRSVPISKSWTSPRPKRP